MPFTRSTLSFGSLNVRPPQVAAGQCIGLLGGSFNPPHEGHRHISEIALNYIGLDKVWWLVTPGNPIKSHDGLTALHQRIEAARDVSAHPRIEVTGFEAAMPTSYTAETVSFLRRRFPGVHFVWLMGADNLVSFHRWQKWQDIFMTLPVAILDRPGYHLKALASPAAHRFRTSRLTQEEARILPLLAPPAWTFITHPLINQSSTALRRQ